MEKRHLNKRLKYFSPADGLRLSGDDLKRTGISESLDTLTGLSGKNLFMKRFSADDFQGILDDIGLLNHLRAIGLPEVKITVKRDEYSINYLKIYAENELPENLLMDLRVTESTFVPDPQICKGWVFENPLYMVLIEWLTLQNPFKEFDEKRPRLPGQASPGLGALKYCFRLMDTVGRVLVKDGFMDVPDHMNGAIMYSRTFRFFDPRHEAILHAIIRDLEGYSLSDISWGMITGTVIDVYKNIPQVYDPSEQIYPTSERMIKYFSSGGYRSVYNKYYKRKKYKFDYDLMLEKRAELLKKNDASEL